MEKQGGPVLAAEDAVHLEEDVNRGFELTDVLQQYGHVLIPLGPGGKQITLSEAGNACPIPPEQRTAAQNGAFAIKLMNGFGVEIHPEHISLFTSELQKANQAVKVKAFDLDSETAQLFNTNRQQQEQNVKAAAPKPAQKPEIITEQPATATEKQRTERVLEQTILQAARPLVEKTVEEQADAVQVVANDEAIANKATSLVPDTISEVLADTGNRPAGKPVSEEIQYEPAVVMAEIAGVTTGVSDELPQQKEPLVMASDLRTEAPLASLSDQHARVETPTVLQEHDSEESLDVLVTDGPHETPAWPSQAEFADFEDKILIPSEASSDSVVEWQNEETEIDIPSIVSNELEAGPDRGMVLPAKRLMAVLLPHEQNNQTGEGATIQDVIYEQLSSQIVDIENDELRESGVKLVADIQEISRQLQDVQVATLREVEYVQDMLPVAITELLQPEATPSAIKVLELLDSVPEDELPEGLLELREQLREHIAILEEKIKQLSSTFVILYDLQTHQLIVEEPEDPMHEKQSSLTHIFGDLSSQISTRMSELVARIALSQTDFVLAQ